MSSTASINISSSGSGSSRICDLGHSCIIFESTRCVVYNGCSNRCIRHKVTTIVITIRGSSVITE